MKRINKSVLKLLPIIIDSIPDELKKKVIDAILDVIENAVRKSKSKKDDMFLLPTLKIIRNILNVPDDD